MLELVKLKEINPSSLHNNRESILEVFTFHFFQKAKNPTLDPDPGMES